MDQAQPLDPSEKSEISLEHGQRWWSWWHVVELAATFLLFAGLMHFLYLGPPGVAYNDIGVPGHDSFYHVKMARLIPQIGLVKKFPWLRTTVFNEQFVNHHYGFHLLLSPFVHLSHWLTGDDAAGGRWFMALSFGVSMALFQLLLMVHRIERRWIWLGLCLVLPSQFYSRHLFVRAINPSLICMLALCLCMFTRAYLAAGIVTFLSIHIYLGAVTFVPVLVGAVFVAGLAGLLGDLLRENASLERVRRELLRFDGRWLVTWTLAGWLIGLATHPYGGLEVLKFLKLQVFGSGLTPDISVGREWKSYSPAWFFANMSGITLTATGIALCLRLRFGGRLRTNELSLLLINMVFFGLTLKARRFIEYWPLFSILSSAYLAGPILGPPKHATPDNAKRESISGFAATGVVSTCLLVIMACLAGAWMTGSYVPDNFAAEWRLWVFLAGVCALVPIVRSWTHSHPAAASAGKRVIATSLVVVSGVVFCATVAALAWLLGGARQPEPARIHLGWYLFAALGLAYAICGAIGVRMTKVQSTHPKGMERLQFYARISRSWVTVATSTAVVSIVIIPAGALFGGLQRKTRCNYDLPAIRDVMKVLQAESSENAVVFTDDWDIFPVFFYVNHRNHYVVGLDPKFSHEKDPVLWERYVRISRGETPASRRVKVLENGRLVTQKISVRLGDIRDYFHAEFVIVDRDHLALAKQLDHTPALAERIFPPKATNGEKPPYLLYRILPAATTDGTVH